jgi:hypothetical protein
MFLSVLGDFTEAVLGLAFSFGCALLLAFLCLRFLVGLMTRQQYNVTVDQNLNNDPSHIRSILWLRAAVARSDSGPDAGPDHAFSGSATGGPYILPAAAPRNHFARISKPDAAPGGRVVELPQFVAGRVTQGGRSDGWGGDSGGAA